MPVLRTIRILGLSCLVSFVGQIAAHAEELRARELEQAYYSGSEQPRPSDLTCMVAAEYFTRPALGSEDALRTMAANGLNLAMAQDHWVWYARAFNEVSSTEPGALASALRSMPPEKVSAYSDEVKRQFGEFQSKGVIESYRLMGACGLSVGTRASWINEYPEPLVTNWLVIQQRLPPNVGMPDPMIAQRIQVSRRLENASIFGLSLDGVRTEMATDCRAGGGIPMTYREIRGSCFQEDHSDYGTIGCVMEREDASINPAIETITVELGCFR